MMMWKRGPKRPVIGNPVLVQSTFNETTLDSIPNVAKPQQVHDDSFQPHSIRIAEDVEEVKTLPKLPLYDPSARADARG